MKMFQEYTASQLDNILNTKEFTVFNNSQIVSKIHNTDNTHIFEAGLNIPTDEINSVKARLRINENLDSTFQMFQILVYENGGKLYYKKNSNRIDCEVSVVFNEEEEFFVITKDYADRLYQNFIKELFQIRGTETNISQSRIEEFFELKKHHLEQLLEHINKSINVIQIDLGNYNFRFPIKDFYYENLTALYNRLNRSMADYIDTQRGSN